MSQLFTLKLTDGTETVDFLGDIYGVMEGGFNISSIRARKPNLALYRPGPFFIPVETKDIPREGEIRFRTSGTDRGEAIENLGKIRRILRRAEARKRWGAGKRVELQYAWEGSDEITYFEVYGGAVDPPEDALSIDKMHVKHEGRYIIPECSCQLWLSTYGYSISPLNGSPTEIALYNPSVGSKQTGGVNINNPYTAHAGNPTAHYNYVEIDGDDIPGSEPYITVLRMTTDPTYWSYVKTFYIGHRVTPFPTKLIFEGDDSLGGGSNNDDNNASKGSYKSKSKTPGGPGVDYFADLYWQLGNGTVGTFYAFLSSFINTPNYWHFAVGVDDYTYWDCRWIGNYQRGNSQGTSKSIPLGVIQLPPGGHELAAMGTLHPNLCVGIFLAYEQSGTIWWYLDYMYLLPIDDGLRILYNRGVGGPETAGYIYDDAWNGQVYRKESSGSYYISAPFFGLMEPIKLEPKIDQRLYFYMHSDPTFYYDCTVKLQVYVVPTFTALAM